MAQLIGVRTTNQAIANESVRMPRQVDEEIADLEPDQAPLITFMMKQKKRKPCKSPRIEWYEQDYVSRWDANGEAIDSSETVWTVVDGTKFVAGDLFIVPYVDGTTTVPDVNRVLSVSGNDLTVFRGGTQTSASGDAIRIIGTAYEENANTPSAKVFAPVLKTSYTEIWRTATGISGTAELSEHYGAPNGERERELAKKLVEHKQSMNASFLWGKPTESLTGGPGGNPLRTTMGLNNTIATNIYDAGGTFTKRGMEEYARMSFRYGKQTKLLLASPNVISAIHEWGNSFMQLTPGTTDFGVEISRVQTGHGVWILVRDWMLEDGAGSSLNGFAGWSFSVDMDSITYKYLANNGKSRDTHLRKSKEGDGQNSGRDGSLDEYLTEAGLQIQVEKRHAKLSNASEYAS